MKYAVKVEQGENKRVTSGKGKACIAKGRFPSTKVRLAAHLSRASEFFSKFTHSLDSRESLNGSLSLRFQQTHLASEMRPKIGRYENDAGACELSRDDTCYRVATALLPGSESVPNHKSALQPRCEYMRSIDSKSVSF